MPQGSIYYAVGRLSMLEKTALDGARLERLLQTKDMEQALRVVSEVGWREDLHFEQAAGEHMLQACTLVRELTTNQALVDAFLVRYDIANLKILLKARALQQEPAALSSCGVFAPDVLRHAVNEHRYDALGTVLKTALDALEKHLAVDMNPMDIDVHLDRAHYAYAFDKLGSKGGTAVKYFRDKVDLTNYAMVLRAMHQNKPLAFIKPLLIPGGRIAPAAWEKDYTRPEKLPLRMNHLGAAIYASAVAAHLNPQKLAAFERDADNHLLGLFTPYRRTISREERLIGHLLMREREAAAVRLILSGKENGFAEETIRERLRALYG